MPFFDPALLLELNESDRGAVFAGVLGHHLPGRFPRRATSRTDTLHHDALMLR
jgi:hypothetical protein